MILLVLFLSHLIADFMLQSQPMAKYKDRCFKTAFYHALIHLASTVVILFICFLFTDEITLISGLVFITVALVSIFHILIDVFGKKLINKILKFNDFFVFLVDQLLHIIIIFAFVFLLVPNYQINNIFISLFKDNIISETCYLILLMGSFFILLTSFTGYLISKLFQSLKNGTKLEELDEVKVIEKRIKDDIEVTTEKIKFSVVENDYGKWIGYCERIIIFLLVLIQVYEGIAIIVALKTFARYQQLNQKVFVEKYLLGTLFSVMMAILLGFLFRSIYFLF